MLGYWFSLTPPALTGTAGQVWGTGIAAAILSGVIVRVLVVRRITLAFARRPWVRVARALYVNGVFLAVLWFFRYEGVPFFGARFWLLILGIGDLVWAIAILRHFLVRLPKERAAIAVEQQKQKYLR